MRFSGAASASCAVSFVLDRGDALVDALDELRDARADVRACHDDLVLLFRGGRLHDLEGRERQQVRELGQHARDRDLGSLADGEQRHRAGP